MCIYIYIYIFIYLSIYLYMRASAAAAWSAAAAAWSASSPRRPPSSRRSSCRSSCTSLAARSQPCRSVRHSAERPSTSRRRPPSKCPTSSLILAMDASRSDLASPASTCCLLSLCSKRSWRALRLPRRAPARPARSTRNPARSARRSSAEREASARTAATSERSAADSWLGSVEGRAMASSAHATAPGAPSLTSATSAASARMRLCASMTKASRRSCSSAVRSSSSARTPRRASVEPLEAAVSCRPSTRDTRAASTSRSWRWAATSAASEPASWRCGAEGGDGWPRAGWDLGETSARYQHQTSYYCL